VELIRKAAERTSNVTAQLLAFSRQQILRPVALELNALVKSWETTLRRVMGEDCTVLLRPGEGVRPIRADPGQLEQVLLNLALNARDAMPRGGTLTVETFAAELAGPYVRSRPGVAIRPGPYVVLAVSDTGHGMDRDTLAHAFEPFFTTKGVGHGTGLGLSTAYGIVKQSDGYVWAYSEPGRGSTFKVYLPVTGADAASSAPPAPAPWRAGRGESVLLVEDDEGVRRMIRRALEEGGYRVLEAANGLAALELVTSTSGRIGLVLTDVVMPGMSGRDLADRVAELRPGTPVLFTSGYTDGEIVRRGLLHPEAAFIQKPFGPDAIVRIVRERLEDASLPSASSPFPSAAALDEREPA
jgi:CheY-like chemotaxis protein